MVRESELYIITFLLNNNIQCTVCFVNVAAEFIDYLELLKDRKFHVHATPVSIEFGVLPLEFMR